MHSFRSGNTFILIAPGVTVRGINAQNVFHVINFDLPLIDYYSFTSTFKLIKLRLSKSLNSINNKNNPL